MHRTGIIYNSLTLSVFLSFPSSRHDTFTDDAGPFLYKCPHQKHRRRAQNILRRLSRPIANDHQTSGRQGTRSIVLWLLLCLGRQRSACNHRNRYRALYRGPPLVRIACPRCMCIRVLRIVPSTCSSSSQEFLFYYEKWEPPKNKNGERARLVSRPPVDRKRGSIQQPFSKVTDSLHEIGTRT